LTETYGTAILIGQQVKNMTEPQAKSPSVPVSSQPAVKFQPVRFVHTRSPQFRTYHADGTWGVVNAQGDIHLSFFVEHPRLVTGVVHQVNPENGTYTGEFQMEGSPDPVYNVVDRDFQCSVVFSVASAERLRSLLDSYIDTARKHIAGQKALSEQKK
jgi:hypothetical protein